MWQVAVLLLLALGTSVNSQGCSLPTQTIIDDGIVDVVESQLGDGNQVVTVDLHHYTYVCLASGGARDIYNWMAIAANYTYSNQIHRRIISVVCDDGEWEFNHHFSFSRSIDDVGVATQYLNTQTPSTDCLRCYLNQVNASDYDTCIACTSSLQCEGLNQCYRNSSTSTDTCCNYYNEDTCITNCPSNHVVDQDFNCVCDQFYQEPDCTACIINSTSCSNNGVANATTCTCDCDDTGYQGDTCTVDVNECDNSPSICQNGQCANTVGGYNCSCTDGYEGKNCEQNIDECLANPCVNGDCTDGVNSYMCDCDEGYTGDDCDVDIDDCVASTCVHGQCMDGVNSYTCDCDTGYTGDNCEFDINECLDSPCANGGDCANTVGGYVCDCRSTGYMGDLCTEDVDECQELQEACQNGGDCRNEVGNYSCSCRGGWAGDVCDICATGYTLYDEACVECNIRDCTQCSSPNVCASCDEGLVIDDNARTCRSTDTQVGNGTISAGVIVAIVIALLLIVILTVVAVVILVVVGVAYKKSQDAPIVHKMKNVKDEQKDIILTKVSEI